MPRKSRQPVLMCEHFSWKLFLRAGVFYADGRSAERNLGKHSLNTRDRAEAEANLRRLDHKMAVDLGLAAPSIPELQEELSISAGWAEFLADRGRSEIMGGVGEATLRRYRQIQKKHEEYCGKHHVQRWCEFTQPNVTRFGDWLVKANNYADRTVYLTVSMVVSACSWLIGERRLPPSCQLHFCLKKPLGSDTFCFSPQQIQAMLERCRAQHELKWLGDVIVTLACSGLRISELISLRASDVDFAARMIRLTDERSSRMKRKLGNVRRTKGKRGRIIPVNPELIEILRSLPTREDGKLLSGPRGAALEYSMIRYALCEKVIKPLSKTFPSPRGEIGFEHARIHSFRHYFVSQAFAGGASETDVKDWVGHRDSKMVELYRHLRYDESQRRMDQLSFVGLPNGSGSPGSSS